MNEKQCEEIMEEWEYFAEKTNNYKYACFLTIALQIRKIES